MKIAICAFYRQDFLSGQAIKRLRFFKQVWTLNAWETNLPLGVHPYVSHQFQLHHTSLVTEGHRRILAASTIPTITAWELEGVTSRVMPIDEIKKKYSLVSGDLSCSIAIMLFYACYLGATQVELMGVHPCNQDEYRWQLPGLKNAVDILVKAGHSIKWIHYPVGLTIFDWIKDDLSYHEKNLYSGAPPEVLQAHKKEMLDEAFQKAIKTDVSILNKRLEL